MTLPEIVLPKVVLPFDIPVLLHPVVDHFLIALPIVVFLIEIINLIFKKRAISGVSLFMLLIILIVGIGAYFTGMADAKEAYDGLSQMGQTALKEHKLLGTYVLLGTGVILLLKLLAMSGIKVLKGLYFLVFIIFILLLFKQGKEGGELVYKYGANIEAVASLKDNIDDLKDDLSDAKDSIKTLKEASKKVEVAPVVTAVVKEDTQKKSDELNQTVTLDNNTTKTTE